MKEWKPMAIGNLQVGDDVLGWGKVTVALHISKVSRVEIEAITTQYLWPATAIIQVYRAPKVEVKELSNSIDIYRDGNWLASFSKTHMSNEANALASQLRNS